jgi:hypothetical protein
VVERSLSITSLVVQCLQLLEIVNVSFIAVKFRCTWARTLSFIALLYMTTLAVAFQSIEATAAKPAITDQKPTAAKPATNEAKTKSVDGKATAQKEVWCIKQNGDWLGKGILYICDSGFKTVYTKGGYVVTMQAPDWKPVYYSQTLKTYFPETQEEFKKSFSKRAGMLTTVYLPNPCTISKGKAGRVFGYPTSTILLNPGRSSEELGKWAEVVTFDEIVDPPVVNKLFGVMYNNCTDHFVARVITHNTGQKSLAYLETESIEKIKVGADFFDPPKKGYKLVQTEFEVTAGSGLVNDLIDDLGSTLGKAPSK